MNELVRGRLTEEDRYMPTPAELKLLEVMLLPENAKTNVSAKCKLAGISRTTYYEITKKPEFVRLIRDTALDLVKAELVSLMHIGIKEARDGSFQHWKVLLEMAGIHSEALQLNVTFEQLLKKALESGE